MMDKMEITTNGDKPTIIYSELGRYHSGAAAKAYPPFKANIGRSWVNNQKNIP
jgi:hypothetical protein